MIKFNETVSALALTTALIFNQAPKANAFNSELQQNLKSTRIDTRIAACYETDGFVSCFDDGYVFVDPPQEFFPIDPTYTLPRTGGPVPGTYYDSEKGTRQWIPNYQQVDYFVSEIQQSDLQNNCSAVFPGSVLSYENGDDFFCRSYDNNTPNGYYDNRPLQKNYLCNRVAQNKFQWFVNSRNLGGNAQFLGGKAEGNSCLITIGTTQYEYQH